FEILRPANDALLFQQHADVPGRGPLGNADDVGHRMASRGRREQHKRSPKSNGKREQNAESEQRGDPAAPRPRKLRINERVKANRSSTPSGGDPSTTGG